MNRRGFFGVLGGLIAFLGCGRLFAAKPELRLTAGRICFDPIGSFIKLLQEDRDKPIRLIEWSRSEEIMRQDGSPAVDDTYRIKSITVKYVAKI